MRPLFAALVLVSLAVPAPAAPDRSKPPDDDAAAIADKLQERAEFDRFDQVSVRTMIEVLQEKLGYTILLDYRAILANIGEEGANRQVLEEKLVTVPALKKVKLETVLRQVLDFIDADFYIESDHIHVTTASRKALVVGPRRTLPDMRPNEAADEGMAEAGVLLPQTPTVTAHFKDIPLAEALKIVSLRTGRAVAINPDAAETAKGTVSVALANASFETAVSTLSEAAGLRAFRNGNAAVIVTPERAKQLESRLATGLGCLPIDPEAGRELHEQIRTLRSAVVGLKK
jgi:hypothetical protein